MSPQPLPPNCVDDVVTTLVDSVVNSIDGQVQLRSDTWPVSVTNAGVGLGVTDDDGPGSEA